MGIEDSKVLLFSNFSDLYLQQEEILFTTQTTYTHTVATS